LFETGNFFFLFYTEIKCLPVLTGPAGGKVLAIGVKSFVESDNQQCRLVLLHDSDGKMLALLPANKLLNLVSLWREAERNLQPTRSDDAIRFFGQKQLLSPEGQQKLLGLPIIIDKSLTDFDQLNVVEPFSQLSFKADKSWLKHAKVLNIGVTLDEIERVQPKGNDEAVITHAVERFTALRIRQRLEDTLGLPSLAPTTQKIIELRSDPAAGVDQLVPVVKIDPSLSAQVMSWSVSPYYAAPGSIQSIEDAIIRVLGFDLVVNLALGIAMGKTLDVPKDTPRNQTPYWKQAVYTATLAERLAKRMPNEIRPKPGLVYLAGLLHNFGYIVLGHLFPPHFSLLSRYIEANPHLPLDTIEKHILHVTREQVGAWLMECWSLPEEVSKAVRYQNDPLNEDADLFAKLVFLANRTLRENGWADGPIEAINQEVMDACQLTPTILAEEVQRLQENNEELQELTQTLSSQ
jgi:HD-like signal output (HDOD) protein